MKWIALLLVFFVNPGHANESHQATGVKVGEISDTSAIVWVRLTADSTRNTEGTLVKGRPEKGRAEVLPPGLKIEDVEGSCPGAPGKARLRYGTTKGLENAQETEWVDISAENDFTHQFRLSNLTPGTVYYFSSETAGPGGEPFHKPLLGQFETAPKPSESATVTFTVVTGQAYRDTDRPDGFHIYEAMGKLKPKFLVPTGDTVYYDSENPRATTIPVARYHWHRMYSMQTLIDFHLKVPGYWMKDDHDTLSDDCWPDKKPEFMLPLTFEDGQRIFLEQVPMGEKTYRTYRWGKHLQVWLPEGRDFRSPNNLEDGPDKTIWGRPQIEWLADSILASNADWKVLISATPIVGPDRETKADNHSNKAFQHEGDTVRKWIQENTPDNLFVACGDRHWQYHSVHPETGVNEFSCGPASDEHAAGSPKDAAEKCLFHRVKGGFLSVTVTPENQGSEIAFHHHDVHGNVVYEYTKR